jgi:signal recognition particle subunit SRP72
VRGARPIAFAVLINDSVSDDALQLIATINKAAIDSLSDKYNPYLAFQAYSEATKSSKPLAARPFGFQSKIIQLDEAILDLSIGKGDAAREKARDRQSLYASEKGFRVVDIAAQMLHKTNQETEKGMERLFATDVKDIGLALTLVQLHMGRGNITGAINVMESLSSNLEPAQRYQPGLVGLLVALYEHQGRKQHVRKVLSEASEWSKNSDNPVSIVVH